MIPFSFFWKRVTDEWLVSKSACTLFGLAAVIILAITAIAFAGLPEGEVTPAGNLGFGILGVLGAVGIFFLWGGMWKFWSHLDSSARWVRRVAFAILVVGVWYGAILYFLLVYLPSVCKDGFGRGRVREDL